MKVQFVLFLMILTKGLYAQESIKIPATISFSDSHSYSFRKSSVKNVVFSKLLKAQLYSTSVEEEAIYELSCSAQKGKTSIIEGIKTVTYVESVFRITIRNLINGSIVFDDEIIINGNGNTEYLATNNCITKFGNQASFREAIKDVINKDLAKMSNDCNSTILTIDKFYNEGKFDLVISASKLVDSPECDQVADDLFVKAYKQKDELYCTEKIQELSIKVESKRYNYNAIVNELLKISPNASCAAEAVELAKKVGKQQAEKESSYKDDNGLNQYITILNNQNTQVRNSTYRKFKYKKR